MDLREEILREHSRAQMLKIVAWVGIDKKRFAELMDLFFHDEYRVVQRAAYPVMTSAIDHPELIQPYLGQMLDYYEKPVHDAVKRNTAKIMSEIELPKAIWGRAANIFFDLLASDTESIGVKVFSMSVLSNLAQKELGLSNELRLLIEHQMPNGSPGFRARGKKILKKLPKI